MWADRVWKHSAKSNVENRSSFRVPAAPPSAAAAADRANAAEQMDADPDTFTLAHLKAGTITDHEGNVLTLKRKRAADDEGPADDTPRPTGCDTANCNAVPWIVATPCLGSLLSNTRVDRGTHGGTHRIRRGD